MKLFKWPSSKLATTDKQFNEILNRHAIKLGICDHLCCMSYQRRQEPPFIVIKYWNLYDTENGRSIANKSHNLVPIENCAQIQCFLTWFKCCAFVVLLSCIWLCNEISERSKLIRSKGTCI